MRDTAERHLTVFEEAEGRARQLVSRALKLRRRAEHRRAALILREACGLDHLNAAYWMMYGNYLAQLRRSDEAEKAIKQALYLRVREGAEAKAQVIRRELLRLRRAA